MGYPTWRHHADGRSEIFDSDVAPNEPPWFDNKKRARAWAVEQRANDAEQTLEGTMADLNEELEAMSKDDLYEFAWGRWGKSIDRRRTHGSLVAEVRAMLEEYG
jgi:hypothetical protein